MDSFARTETEGLLRFIKSSPTAYQAVDTAAKMLDEAGFTRLTADTPWNLTPGQGCYVTRNGSSILAFRIPKKAAARPVFQIVASHSDSPTFKLKPCPELTSARYTRLHTEVYGGVVYNTWLDRPLSVAGRIVVRENGGFYPKNVVIDRDLVVIPNVAVHQNRNLNGEYKYDPGKDLFPLLALGGEGKLRPIVAEAAGVAEDAVTEMDLFLYNRTPGVIFGAENEFFSCPRIDNLQCAYGSLRGFLAAKETGNVTVCAVFDNEETGSTSRQGANSDFLRIVLTRIAEAMGQDASRMTEGSFMVSADNGHAVHPNHPELSDPVNAPVMGGGVVLKQHASQKYTTDAVSGAVFAAICERANLPLQRYCNRSDLPGGSTLGNIANSQVSMATVDIGMAQLAMHSSYETGAAADNGHLVRTMTAFYESRITPDGDGFRLESTGAAEK